MAKQTPMMQQYMQIKAENPDSILFFRLGDFYEMFNEDAKTASKELDLTLTTRDRNKPEDQKTPMCGVPYHSSDAYIARLIAKGYKVAICEQTEDPATAKGLVKRDITRVVTPGTVIDDTMLEANAGNYICGLYADSKRAGVCFCDISTGKTCVTAFTGKDRLQHVFNEMGRFTPAEAVLSDEAFANEKIQNAVKTGKLACHLERGGERRFLLKSAEDRIQRQFGMEALGTLPAGNPAAAMAVGGLLDYLYETQKRDLSHINKLEYYEQGRFMELDLTARRNLELTETLRGQEKRGSLLWVIDKTKTPMGGRMIRSFLERPLLSVAEIDRRNRAVSQLVDNTVAREELTHAMTGLGDMERLIGRIVYGTAGGRDLASLRAAMDKLPEVKAQLDYFSNGRLRELCDAMDSLTDLRDLLWTAICDEPPFTVREGGVIRDGYDAEVDRLREILSGGKGVIAELEAKEKEQTGIRNLRLGYNKVFGYYIEIPRSAAEQVPEHYIRKQTTVNNERYITQELKDLEHTVMTASDRVKALEYNLFTEIREQISAQAARIQKTAAAIAEADALASLAVVAVRNNYCCPVVDESGVIEIHDGRHPVVEKMMQDTLFVPNDTFMGETEKRTAIITGPNMAGKSTYMRQVALIVLLAQMGSFVPASSARIGVVDRIFTRIGASDDLAGGRSTFMVEMTEVADILQAATARSLLILDEIGRGTSTYDGMSIARAVVEYCTDRKRLGAKTLFATHYHELTALEQTLPGTVNYNIAVRTRGDEIIFLRKILEGGADRSYGIEVAQMAGLPDKVVAQAKEVLQELEADDTKSVLLPVPQPDTQLSMNTLCESEVCEKLRNAQPDAMTPIEAMGLLYELKQKLQ